MSVHHGVEVFHRVCLGSATDAIEVSVGVVAEADEVNVGVGAEVVRSELDCDRAHERLRGSGVTGHCDGTERLQIEQQLTTIPGTDRHHRRKRMRWRLHRNRTVWVVRQTP